MSEENLEEKSEEQKLAEPSKENEPVEAGLDQEALARRVAALGEQDETEKIARAEEEKLRARTAGTKKPSSKLANDASRRLERIGEKKKRDVSRATPQRPPPDKFVSRGQGFTEWLKRNQRQASMGVGFVLLVGIGYAVFESFQTKKAEESASLLAEAVRAEFAPVVSKKEDDENGPERLTFKTVEERRAATLEKLKGVQAKFKGTGAGYLAQLSEASILLDQHDLDGALAAYTSVRNSPLGQVDLEVRGRALEGIGFVQELKGQKDPKALEEAQKTFRELELTEARGFKELGIYHQARVAQARGDAEKAKELLKDLRGRFEKSEDRHEFDKYLEEAVDNRLRALDPSAVPAKPAGMMGMGHGGGKQVDDAQIKKLMEQLQKQMKEKGTSHGDKK